MTAVAFTLLLLHFVLCVHALPRFVEEWQTPNYTWDTFDPSTDLKPIMIDVPDNVVEVHKPIPKPVTQPTFTLEAVSSPSSPSIVSSSTSSAPSADTIPPSVETTPPSNTVPPSDEQSSETGGIVEVTSGPIRGPGSGFQPSNSTGSGSTGSGNTKPPPATAGNPTGQKVCDSASTIPDNGYLVMANIWDAAAGNGGHQCAETLSGGSGSGISWQTEWQWSGNSIVSFAMANGQSNVPCGQVSSIQSIPTTFQWSYSTTAIEADVAYDIFTGSGECTPVGSHAYEIMIWLAGYGGLLPIGNAAGTVGDFSSQGSAFSIYKGAHPSGNGMMVYSFYPTAGPIENFSGDLKPFLDHVSSLDAAFGATTLQSIQAGTEAQSGSATFVVSDYSIGGGSSQVATS